MTELARAVVRIEGDISDFEAALALASEEMDKTGKHLESLGRSLTAKVTLPLVAVGALAVKEFGEQEDALTRLNAILQATGHVSGETTQGITRMAHAIQDVTRFDSDAVVEASALLTTFQRVRNEMGAGNQVFDRAIKAAVDLAAAMGTDLQTATLQLGRALEEPATGLMLLRRAGIQFSADEQQQIKTLVEHNRLLDAQRIILEKVEGKTRGVAAAMAQTPLGQFAQAWNAVKDSLKPIGGIIAETLVPFARMVRNVAIELKGLNSSLLRTAVVIGAVAAALGPVLVVVGQLLKLWKGAAAVFGLAGGTLGLVIAAIASVGVAIAELIQNWDMLKLKVQLVWLDIKLAVLGVIASILSVLAGFPGAIGEAFGSAFAAVMKEMHTTAKDIATTQAAITKDILSAGDVAGEGGRPPHGKPPLKDTLSPESRAAVNKALEDLNQALDANVTMAEMLGDAFDKTSADAAAAATAFDALSKIVGVHLTTPLSAAAGTLRNFGDDLAKLQAKAFLSDLAKQLDLIERGAGGAAAKANVFLKAISDFAAKSPEVRAELEAQGKGIDFLRGQYEQFTLKAQIGQFFQDEIGKMVDALFEGKQHFADFVRDMLFQLSMLILKFELLHLIGGIGGGSVGRDLGLPGFATGGFLEPGQFGLVGESGPELVHAGRSGAMVAPLSMAQGTAGDGGGNVRLTVPVSITVQAIDSKGVLEFFDENQGLVAGAMLKAVQRSDLLRRAG